MKLIELKIKLIKKVIKKLKIKFVFFLFFWFMIPRFQAYNGNEQIYTSFRKYSIFYLHVWFIYVYYLVYKIRILTNYEYWPVMW